MSSKFIIKPDFWQVFPQTEIAVITAKGIDNSGNVSELKKSEIQTYLNESCEKAKAHLTEANFSENPVIAVWRKAYQQFKTKKGVRCSIEAMLKRVEKGVGIGSINPLVDIYNGVSLTYGLPCGGEDIDEFSGDLLLTHAIGGEPFLALGDEKESEALPGEVVYKDDIGIVCRCWNWRDGQRTMLTTETTNAFLVIESVDPSRSEDLKMAAETLASKAEQYLGGKWEVTYMTSEHSELIL